MRPDRGCAGDAGALTGLERVGETQGSHRVVLVTVKAVVEPGLLGRCVALQRITGGASRWRRGAAGYVDLGLGAALEHDAQVEYQRQAAVDGAPVADAEVRHRPVEIHLGVERADIRSEVRGAVDGKGSTRRRGGSRVHSKAAQRETGKKFSSRGPPFRSPADIFFKETAERVGRVLPERSTLGVSRATVEGERLRLVDSGLEAHPLETLA